MIRSKALLFLGTDLILYAIYQYLNGTLSYVNQLLFLIVSNFFGDF